MKKNFSKLFIGFLLILTGFFRRAVAFAEDESFSATLTDFTGTVTIIKTGETEAFPVALNIPVTGKGIRSLPGAASSAEILVDDGSLISIAKKVKLN